MGNQLGPIENTPFVGGTLPGVVYVDASGLLHVATGRIGVSTSETVFNDGSADVDFRVESDGNANMIFVDAGNNRVNIGSNSLAYTLGVNGTLYVSGAATYDTSIRVQSGSDYIELGNSGGKPYLRFFDSTVTNTTITTDGNAVNINTGLTVTGAITTGAGFGALGLAAVGTGVSVSTTPGAVVIQSANGSSPFMTFSETAAGFQIAIGVVTTSGDLVFQTGPSSATTFNGTERMRLVKSNGRLGINETSPDYLLDVNGTFGFSPGTSVTPADNGDVVIEATDNTTLTFKLKGSDGTVRSGTITLS